MLLGGGLLALLLIVGGVSAFTAQQHAKHEKQLAGTFVTDVLAGDDQNSYAMFGSAAQNTQAQSTWTEQVKKLSSFFKGASPQFQKLTDSGDKAVVTYTISGSDGNYVLTVTMNKGKADWQVLTFTSLLQTT